jgi:hypothetical protein
MIRREMTEEVLRSASEYPVVTILGPRQSGKTTLARMLFPDKPWVSLEDPDVRLAAEADPRGFLGQFPDGAILDEIQRYPALLSYLQGIVDREGGKGCFVLTGSHQPRLHEVVSQSLAGRTAVLTLWPFSLAEIRHYVPPPDPFEIIVRGCYPRVHEERLDPRRFYNGYVQTYVERDVRALIQPRLSIRPGEDRMKDIWAHRTALRGGMKPAGGVFPPALLANRLRFWLVARTQIRCA